MNDACYAQSSPKKALAWTTLAFFGGFAGVSAFGPIIPKLNESLVLTPVLMALLGASPALTGSLLRIPFGALVDRYGGKVPILILLGLSSAGMAGTLLMFLIFPDPQSQHYIYFLLTGIFCGCGIAIFSVGMGFANAAVFKLVPKYMPAHVGGTAGIVGGLGAFGGFVIPIFLGIIVDVVGIEGYAYGFSVFVVLSIVSLGLFMSFRKANKPS